MLEFPFQLIDFGFEVENCLILKHGQLFKTFAIEAVEEKRVLRGQKDFSIDLLILADNPIVIVVIFKIVIREKLLFYKLVNLFQQL